MKLLQIAFFVVIGTVCFATYATSQTLHDAASVVEQDESPAPRNI